MKTYQAFFSTDPRTKKHKVYDEGVILLDGVSITLLDDGKAQLARQPNKCTNLSEGQTLNIGKYTVDVGKECPTSGPVAVRASTPAVASAPRPAATTSMHQQPLRPPSALLHSTAISHSVSGEIPTPFQQEPAAPVPRRAPLASLPVGRGGFKAPRQQLVPRCDDVSSSIEQFKPDPPSSAAQLSLLLPPPPQLAPVVASLGLGAGRGAGVARRPAAVARHDPLVSGALVLQETSLATDASALGAAAGIAVVVDPLLAAPMRPHQREAVRFMWECVQGLRGEAGRRGCILADDMGMGKTLSTIALMWTLLKQSSTGLPAISRAVIVCPSSLVGNWRAEIKKWLGDERMRPVAVTSQGEEAAAAVRDFVAGSAAVRPVLIISYEMLRKHVDLLTAAPSTGPGGGGSARIGLLVCDEAHRLKSAAGSKTLTALGTLVSARRVLLTGTPIQNDLSELYAMASFAVPGSLGPLAEFKRIYERPIVAGRDGDADPDQRTLASERSADLSTLLAHFILRRSSSVLEALLPPKTETSLFCRLSPLQQLMYAAVVDLVTNAARRGVSGGDAHVLVALNLLRQICGHAELAIARHGEESEKTRGGVSLTSGATDTGASVVTSTDKLSGKRRRSTHSRGRGAGDADSCSDRDEEHAAMGEASVDNGSELEMCNSEEDSFDGGSDCGSGAPASTHAGGDDSMQTVLRSLLPRDFVPLSTAVASGDSATVTRALSHGSKLAVLDALLQGVRAAAPLDRVVIVSNFGRMLDLVQALCAARGWVTTRLDGSTPSDQRTALVKRFNARDAGGPFLFLLSAQAGGAGINLIGANRLVLMDSSWNPAIDAQAMARVWRDGQLRPCFIYRLACTSTLDEKILQRQLLKADVANAMGHGGGAKAQQAGGAGLSRAELLELFALNPRDVPPEGCDTRRMIVARAAAEHDDAAVRRASAWPPWAGKSVADDSAATAAIDLCSQTTPGSPLITYAKRVSFNTDAAARGGDHDAGASAAAAVLPASTCGVDALDLN